MKSIRLISLLFAIVFIFGFVPAAYAKQKDTPKDIKTVSARIGKVLSLSSQNSIFSAAKKPSVPKGLSVTKTTNSSISLKWSKVSGVSKYKIYVATSKTGKYSSKGTTKSMSFTVKGLKKNKTYYLKVSALNAKGEGAKSGYISGKATAKPAAPAGFKAALTGTQTVRLQWNKALNASYYKIRYWKNNPSGSYYWHEGNITGTSVSLTGLDYNTDYYFQVVAYNKDGNASSVKIKIKTGNHSTAPKNLFAYVSGIWYIDLSWSYDGDDSNIGFCIYAADSAGGPYSLLETTMKKFWTIIDITPNTYYYYRVSATTPTGEGDMTEPLEVYVSGKPVLQPADIIPGGFGLVWDYIPGANYKIYYATSPNGPYNFLKEWMNTDYTFYYSIDDFEPNSDYWFKISSYNAKGESLPSEAVHVHTGS